jgi:hypothetical protein
MIFNLCDMWYEAPWRGGGSHGCCATDYCIVGGRGPTPDTGRDFSIAHGAGEPSGAGPHYSGLPRRAVGLCRGAGDGGEPTDSDAVFGTHRRTGGVGGAGRPRAHGTGCEDHGGGQNLACRAGLREADAIRLPARAVDDPSAGGACARSRTARRPSEPGEAGPRNGVQDPRRA